MRPDISSLALFVRIAEARSLTKAADASHIALAAASRRVAQLEHQFGVQLLYRTTRGVELTPAGHALLFHAKQMLTQVDEMRAEISDYSSGVKGMVRIHANASALAQYLPDDLASFAAKHPAVKLSLGEERSVAIVEAVHAGAADLGIVMEGADAKGLELMEYRTDTLAAVLPKSHRLKSKKVAFEQLLDEDFVGLESNTVISSLMAQSAHKAGKPLRLRVQVKSFDIVARMVVAGLGLGVLPDGTARTFGPMGLRYVALTEAWARRRMYVCVRQYSGLPAPARQLVDHLVPRRL